MTSVDGAESVDVGDSPPEVTIETLESTSLFRNVDLDFLIDRLEKCQRRQVSAGEVLIEEGQENTTLYVVLSGRLQARLRVDSVAGLVSDVAAGDCVGEMSVIDGRPATASVQAVENSWLLELPQALIWTLVDRTTFVSRNLLYILAGRLRMGNLTIGTSHEEITRLHEVVHRDALTGLRNRRWFDEHLELAIEQELRTGEPLSLILLDIDHFKRFNDAHGHAAGDEVLRRVAAAIDTVVGQGEGARSGGEEFAVILQNTAIDTAAATAERIRVAVETLGTVHFEGRALPPVTVSLGVARLGAGEAAAEFAHRTDKALYEAKDQGRNRVKRGS